MSKTFHSIAVLGRQPKIGIAELESIFGADEIESFGADTALIARPTDEIDFQRLGGSTRMAKILKRCDSRDFDIAKDLERIAVEISRNASSKINFGLSSFGYKISPKKLSTISMGIKRSLNSQGHRVRLLPQKAQALNTATDLHNKLTRPASIELLVISN